MVKDNLIDVSLKINRMITITKCIAYKKNAIERLLGLAQSGSVWSQ